MSMNWINPEEYPFNSFLLLDDHFIRVIKENLQGLESKKHLGIALAYNPAVLWYFSEKCPECKNHFEGLVKEVSKSLSKDEVRESELYIINLLDTMIVYAYPEIMDELTYITGWEKERILSITDFNDKKVLDLGSGTGRLAFAVAPHAKYVYAVEPGERLRYYLREKQKKLNVNNLFVVDGTIQSIPFEDDSFDIIMSGHVIGDDYEKEYQELCRVLKSGGYIIDCPGEDERKKDGPIQEMLELGFEYSHYESKFGGDVYRYWKKVIK
ncbi:class I SAM-dependent methyltransferase [Haloplasma contractile]|uniref:Ubiquinone-menaquinone biosynthesis methyltransferase protein n=1 Tax=Haloplasma contractile SSD-17B TaxID=1033810 RepID=F7Q1X4_9MOLU|nr:class I SAM-dependent methyltransferase [Haloplasma contractile]ERJ12213.1 ubiquinone-menaquinone biosynthesis methyltransferase protein [Haloplasma contractile SSD-17B]